MPHGLLRGLRIRYERGVYNASREFSNGVYLIIFDTFWYTVPMDSLLKADIFFVVATVAVCAVSVVAIYVLAYMVRIVRNVEDISDTVKKETKKVSQDMDGIREHIGKYGALPRFLMRWMGRSSGKANAKRERGRKTDKNNS